MVQRRKNPAQLQPKSQYNVKQNKMQIYEIVTATDFTLSFEADHHQVQSLAMLVNKRKATKPETIKGVEVWCVGEVDIMNCYGEIVRICDVSVLPCEKENVLSAKMLVQAGY
jgi:hypothetical protein